MLAGITAYGVLGLLHALLCSVSLHSQTGVHLVMNECNACVDKVNGMNQIHSSGMLYGWSILLI